MMFFAQCSTQSFIEVSSSGIEAVIADHLEMFFRDMADKTLNEIEGREGFFYIDIVFVAIVVKCDMIAIVIINTGSCDYRSSKIAADVFHDFFGIAFSGSGIYVESVLVVVVDRRFNFLK